MLNKINIWETYVISLNITHVIIIEGFLYYISPQAHYNYIATLKYLDSDCDMIVLIKTAFFSTTLMFHFEILFFSCMK